LLRAVQPHHLPTASASPFAMANKAQSVYSHDLREEPDYPLCGTLKQQPEASKNTLLVKPSLGTVKATCWDLPSKGDFQHEYGLRQKRDGVTSGDVVGDWAQHKGTGDKLPGRDFKALNAMAVVAGGYTSKDIADFRTTHDARLKVGSAKTKLDLAYDDGTTFGKGTPASVPFADLMAHSYRFDWAEGQPPLESVIQKPKKPGQTKTSLLAAQVSRAKLSELDRKDDLPIRWKHGNFKDVPAKIGYQG